MAREFTATRQARTVACKQHDCSTAEKRKRTDISFPLTPKAYKKCICINKAELSALLPWDHPHWRWVRFRQKRRRVIVSAVTGCDLPASYYRVARVWASRVPTDSTENAPSDSRLSHLTYVAAVLHPLSEKNRLHAWLITVKNFVIFGHCRRITNNMSSKKAHPRRYSFLSHHYLLGRLQFYDKYVNGKEIKL